MYQYRGYSLQYTESAVLVRNSTGDVIGYFENDAEAADYIDGQLDSTRAESTARPKLEPEYYIVYRIASQDKDCYDNYQYFDGKKFRYKAIPKKMTKSDAEALCKKYMKWDSFYRYHVGK